MLLALTAFTLELVALWFQHVMLLRPCVMCIYERCALLGIMFAGLIGAIAHDCSPPAFGGVYGIFR